MDAETRLSRALAAPVAPARDSAFTFAVMRAAEQARFRSEALHSMLRWGGFAAAKTALAVPALAWAGANPAALQNGALTTAAVFTLVWAARALGRRSAAAFAR